MAERVIISPDEVKVDGKVIMMRDSESEFVTRIYREFVGGYPKFYKMDGLSQLGFVAAELLLSGIEDKSEFGVSLVTRCGCLFTDLAFIETVAHNSNFYPSPSLFVYTLPNIVAGEIAIRHGIYGETCVYMANDRDEAEVIFDTVPNGIVGWIDYAGPDDFYCEIFLKHS